MPILLALAGIVGYALLRRPNVSTATPPSSPAPGQVWQYSTPDGMQHFAQWNGSAWVEIVR